MSDHEVLYISEDENGNRVCYITKNNSCVWGNWNKPIPLNETPNNILYGVNEICWDGLGCYLNY